MPEIVLPPLTPKEIGARDHQENLLNIGLNECWRGDDFDAERAEKLVRAYAIEIFDTLRVFYRAKIGYRAEWLPGIVHEAAFRALTIYRGHSDQSISRMGDIANDTLLDHLNSTSTSEYARSEFNTAFPLTERTPDSFLADGPPRPTDRTKPTTNEHTSEEQRGAIVVPILEVKGWSILDWANDAGVAYHTADDYLKGKRTPYRSTIKKMADSLGITIQQLPH